MPRFYRREFELLIDGDEFVTGNSTGRQLRVTFDVLLDFGGAWSYADVRIYNLSQSEAQRVFKRGAQLGIRAGYADTVDYLFRGTIRNQFRERENASTVTRIIARGGAQPLATISQTIGKNAGVVEIIRACADAMGYPLVINPDDFASATPYPRGYVLNGDPRAYLDNLARVHGFSYTMDNERLIVVGNESYRAGDPFVVSQFTGMVGIPEITEVGVDVSVRLNPKIRIGGRIDVRSDLKTFNFSNLYFQNLPEQAGVGVYRVFKLRHAGDTHGDEWTSSITGYR